MSTLRTEMICRCLYSPWHEAHSGPSANVKWKSGYRKQPKCPLTAEWISKVWCSCTRGDCLALEREEILTHSTTWMYLENVMLNGISQSQKRQILFDSTNMDLLELWSWWTGVKIVTGDRKRGQLVFSELGFQLKRRHLQNNVNVVNGNELDT